MPAEAVTRVKQRKLRAAGRAWLRATGVRAGDLRFDVASVLGGKLEVIEAASDFPGLGPG